MTRGSELRAPRRLALALIYMTTKTYQLRLARVALASGLTILPWTAGAAPTEPLSLEHYVRPNLECSTCHLFLNPPELADEPNVSPQAYAGSLMANSARDPVFWAGVAIAAQDAPGETEDCIRCHAPVAFLEGRGDAIAVDELEPADLDGVSCELCHRMIDDFETPAGNARFVIDDEAEGSTVPRRGPWTYAPNEDPQHPTSDDNAFLASSRSCGTCHDVTTPRERVDGEGQPMGVGFNEQRTYSEWLGSAYAEEGGPLARSCQDCHMPAVADVAGCMGFNLGGKTHATGGRRHELVGLNLGALTLVEALYSKEVGGPIESAYFDFAREHVEALRTQSATIELEAPAEVDLTLGIDSLTVTVTNETGHKLPSGYAEGRVMWIELVASYDDAVVYSSGLWDEARQVFQDDEQLRRYEALAEDFDDGTQLHLLRNNHWIVDSRIPPRGLTPNLETDPVGDRYALQDDNTWPHFDTALYAFPPAVVAEEPDAASDLLVRARLLYLINTPDYVEFLVEINDTNDAGTALAGLFEEHGPPAPIVLAEQTLTIPLSGLESATTGDAGSSGGEDTTTAGPDASTGTSADASAGTSGLGDTGAVESTNAT